MTTTISSVIVYFTLDVSSIKTIWCRCRKTADITEQLCEQCNYIFWKNDRAVTSKWQDEALASRFLSKIQKKIGENDPPLNTIKFSQEIRH